MKNLHLEAINELLADDEPHTFVELYRLLETKIRPDVAVALYNRENPTRKELHPLQTKVICGKRRVIQQLLTELKRKGLIIQEGRGLTSRVRRVTDATTQAQLQEEAAGRSRAHRADIKPGHKLGRPYKKKPKGEVNGE